MLPTSLFTRRAAGLLAIAGFAAAFATQASAQAKFDTPCTSWSATPRRRHRPRGAHRGRQARRQAGRGGGGRQQARRGRPPGGAAGEDHARQPERADARQPGRDGRGAAGLQGQQLRPRARLRAGVARQRLRLRAGRLAQPAGARAEPPAGLDARQPHAGQRGRAGHRQPAALLRPHGRREGQRADPGDRLPRLGPAAERPDRRPGAHGGRHRRRGAAAARGGQAAHPGAVGRQALALRAERARPSRKPASTCPPPAGTPSSRRPACPRTRSSACPT